MAPEMKEWLVENQYRLPSRLNYLAFRYPAITWEQAQKFYALCVEEVIISNNAKNLYDSEAGLGFGRGLVLTRNLFIEKLNKYFREKEIF